MKISALPLIAAIALAPSLAVQSNSTPPQDSATFDADGTAHITRVVPMPSTISPEAQQWLTALTQQKGGEQTLAERRPRTDDSQSIPTILRRTTRTVDSVSCEIAS
jgi:monoterpene epsilon-lactone hydrolase